MTFPLPLNVLYGCWTIKFAVGTMADSLHNWLRTSLAISLLRLLFRCIWEDSYIRGQEWSFAQFTVKKRNQLVWLAEPILQFKGSVQYVQKGHPTLQHKLIWIFTLQSSKYYWQSFYTGLSSLQATLWDIALVNSFLFPLKDFEKSCWC